MVDRLNKTKIKNISKSMERGSPLHGPRGAFGDHFEGLGAPLEVHFGVLGWPWAPLGIILKVLGHPWKSILGSWGGLGRPLWGSGGTPGRVRRAVVAKEPPTLSPLPRFNGFRRPK